jgi:hypothetical protein
VQNKDKKRRIEQRRGELNGQKKKKEIIGTIELVLMNHGA